MIQSGPPGFPANIAINQQDFKNWDWQINVPNLWTCTPQSADDVVQVCNWAKDNNFQVRPRGIMHSWSPITVTNGENPNNVILVDTMKHLTAMELIPASGAQSARVKAGVGATMNQLLGFLEQQSGGQGAASGYSFPHAPAPGNITVGGALAIDAHGSGIPSPADSFNASYGSLSNQIVEFTAVVFDSDSGQYKPVTFKRGQGDDKAFLTHVGRAFLLDATLQVIDNYNLRCQTFMNISWQTLFQAPSDSSPIPPNSLADFLSKTGRVEAIWFPFSDYPWFKVWSNSPTQPAGSRLVNAPYNYAFSDNVPDFVTDLFKLLLGVLPPTPANILNLILEIIKWLTTLGPQLNKDNSPTANQLTDSLHDISGGLTQELSKVDAPDFNSAALTPYVAKLMAFISAIGIYLDNAGDIWGPSKNTLLYVQDTTLHVTANGYAVHLRSQDVQQAVSDFANKFNSLLLKYQSNNEYPINSPLEIRVTSLDDPGKVSVDPGMTAQSPVISALSMDSTDVQNGWDTALWLDVLTLPGTPSSNAFYAELEDWMATRFSGKAGKALPEWSKGWAYSEQGPWTSPDFLKKIREMFTEGRSADDNWNWEVATLKKYDPNNLFSNPFLDQLMISD